MLLQPGSRVLWVNPSFLDYRIPLYNELNKRLNGHFHFIYSHNRVPERCHDRLISILGENAHPLESERIFSIGNSASDFANSSINIPFPKGLYKTIKKVKPNILIAEGFFQFTPWALFYAIVHRKPIFIAYERTAHTERNCPWWRKFYRNFVSLFIKGFLANGSLTKEYLISQGIKENKIFTGCMCADSKDLRTNSQELTDRDKINFESKIGLNPIKGIRYTFVGRLIELKGINYLLNVWRDHCKEFPDDEMVIVGEGPLLENYRQDYLQDKSIKFLGSIPYHEIYKIYSISDVFVIPTLEDNWSLVVPEAMACGLPIACSIYNGCHPELVHMDINGITFDPLSPDSIRYALSYFHSHDLKVMGEASSRIELDFTPEKTADKILKAFRNL
ncbi:MAG: glycosyltransferase family 4 protein [Muribaculaceae bacterium]|nr:glycosyltransferase family 4 protein [Muribaculaceae bacterium]